MWSMYRAYASTHLPENFFRYPVNFLRILGVDLMNDETLFYSIWSKLLISSSIISIIYVEGAEVYMLWPDVDLCIAIMSYLISHITGGIKIWILFQHRKKIGNLIKSIHLPPFAPNNDRTDGETKLIRDVIKKVETQTFVYILILYTSLTIGFTKFLYSWAFLDKANRKLPYVPTMSFFDYKETPWFQFAGLYHGFVVHYLAAVITSTYVLIASIMAHISRQMIIVGNEFRTVKRRAEKLRQETPGREIEYYIRICFKETMSHHLLNFEMAKDIERLCSIIMLMVFLSSAILLCFLLYYTVSMPLFSIPFIQNLLYFLLVACHNAMYCFWGDAVTVAAADVADAAAESEWYTVSDDIAKSMIMVMVRAQRPLYMTAGKFVPLSITTFGRLIKGALSYYMFLKQTNEVE